jgi:adenylate cyclase
VDSPGVDGTAEAAALVAAFVAENRTDVTLMFGALGVLLCLPAVTSAAGKLADAVMERIGPLTAAMDAVAHGERGARLEEGGSEDFREVARHFNAMVEGLWVARNMEDAFGSYVSPEVMAAIKAQHGNADLPATVRNASVMFSDIRGFTTLSEALSPQQVVAVLNRYLSAMVEVVGSHQGYLDKFIGDAVVVVFNGPVDQPDHAARAVACAVDMLKRLDELNAQGAFPELSSPLAIGLGVATGPMVCGNIGGAQKRQYTVIGDTVNLGSRVEGMTKKYGALLLVTRATADALPVGRFELRAVDRVAVKGKTEAVGILEVLDALPPGPRALRLGTRAEFTQGCLSLDRGALDAAVAHLERVVSADGDDVAAARLLERARGFQRTGLPAGWDGSVKLDSK